MADRRSIFSRLIGHWSVSVRRTFPERQILVRNDERVHCFRLGTIQQILITGTVAGCALWALLATAAYMEGNAELASKETEIASKAAELDGLKANYQAAFGRLDEFQAVFSGITCEISNIQDSLLRMTEHSVATGKRGGPPALARLDPNAGGCRGSGDRSASPSTVAGQASDTRRIVGSLKDGQEQEALRQRVAELEQSLEKLRASHDAFIQHSADLTALRIGELEKTLAAVGVDAKTVAGPLPHRQPASDAGKSGAFGRGGPFIALRAGSTGPDGNVNPVALFNSHADRLDRLTSTLHSLPLAAPLADFEVTSPFGGRNDPINNQSGIHEGVDLGAPSGTPVMATGDGRVVWAGWKDRYGMVVDLDHGLGVHTRYAHLSKALVAVGQQVNRGTAIGLVGETGRTTGPHLHYEVRMDDEATNPMKFITVGHNVLKIP